MESLKKKKIASSHNCLSQSMFCSFPTEPAKSALTRTIFIRVLKYSMTGSGKGLPGLKHTELLSTSWGGGLPGYNMESLTDENPI